MGPQRRSKLTDLTTAAAQLSSGNSLVIGGLWFHNRPAALVRELVRRRIGDLTLYSSPPSSLEPDLLIGAGLVKKAYLAHVSFEYMGLAPNFRSAGESGKVEFVECDEATIIGGLMATAEGLPYHPVRSLWGSDLLKNSPMTKIYRSPEGEELIAVKAIAPDVAILHAQQADEYGNVRHLGSVFADLLMAKAAKKVIVTVDEVISQRAILNEPYRTTIPGYLVDAVVEVPFGAHPASSHLTYIHDEEHLRAYIEAGEASRKGSDPQAFGRYLQKFVYEPTSHWDYLERAGGLAKMNQLRKEAQVG